MDSQLRRPQKTLRACERVALLFLILQNERRCWFQRSRAWLTTTKWPPRSLSIARRIIGLTVKIWHKRTQTGVICEAPVVSRFLRDLTSTPFISSNSNAFKAACRRLGQKWAKAGVQSVTILSVLRKMTRWGLVSDVTAPSVIVFKKRLEKVWKEVFPRHPHWLNTPHPSHLHTTY